jgi:2,3-dihydroxybenzoate-AMP ligase
MTRTARPTSAGTVPWPADVAKRYAADGYWAGLTVGAHILAAADAAPDKVALVDGDRRMTYRELSTRVDGAALRLRDLGLGADDRIVVQLPNRWELVVLALACLRLGAPPVMALPAHRRHELQYLAEHAEAKAIAVPCVSGGFDHQAMAEDLACESEFLEHVLVAGDDVGPANVDLSALCDPATDPAAARAVLDASAPDSRTVALFLLSGGTTGLPKLIARTHDDWAYAARQSARVCEFGPDTVYLAVLPISHNYTLGGPGVIGTLLVGGRVVIAGSPVPGRALSTIERERVTVTSLVPAIAQRWLEFRADDRGHDLSSLRLLQVGGARLPDHAARRIGPLLGCTVQQGYGMAEGLICFTRPGDPDNVTCGTQGRPISPADELRLIGADGEPTAPGEPGILLTRGPYTPRGYYRAPEHNASAFTADGWYRTGDIVRLRADGNLVVEGRDKDMINRGGEKISAEEVENFAYQVDGVRQAAAVAMPDPLLGERVCLFVVLASGSEVALRDVRAVMQRAGVARFKLPERLVSVGSLPATNVGKTDKKALRAEIAALLAAEADAA